MKIRTKLFHLIIMVLTVGLNLSAFINFSKSANPPWQPWQPILTFGGGGTANGEFSGPVGISYSGGYFLIADSNNNRVEMYHITNGADYITTIGNSNPLNVGDFNQPKSATLANNGKIYVADTLNSRVESFIRVYNPDNSFYYQYSGEYSGTYDGVDLGQPTGVIVGSNNYLYIADPDNQRIVVLDLGNSTYIQSIGLGTLDMPEVIALNANDDVIIGDNSLNAVYIFYASTGYTTSSSFQIGNPINGITVDNTNGNIILTAGGVVYIYNESGSVLVDSFETGYSGTGGVAIDGDGNIFTVDRENNFVQEWAIDKTPPIISIVTVDPVNSYSAIINWETDEPAKFWVNFSDSTGFNFTTVDSGVFVDSGQYSITCLNRATTYNFTLYTEDQFDNVSSYDSSFTTNTGPSTNCNPPLTVISNVLVNPGDTSVTITWDTNVEATTYVDYGMSDTYGTLTTEHDISPTVLSHSEIITGLTPNTNYFFNLKSLGPSHFLVQQNLGQYIGSFSTTLATQEIVEGVPTGQVGGIGIVPDTSTHLPITTPTIVTSPVPTPTLPVHQIIKTQKSRKPIATSPVKSVSVAVKPPPITYPSLLQITTVDEPVFDTQKVASVDLKIPKSMTTFAPKAIMFSGLFLSSVAAVTDNLAALPVSATQVTFLPMRMLLNLLTFLGIRRRRRPWGVVYNVHSKQIIDPVTLELRDIDGQVVAKTVTDVNGKFSFDVNPGFYALRPQKDGYIFPSLILARASRDEIYSDLYFGNFFNIKERGESISLNIPMDPVSDSEKTFVDGDNRVLNWFAMRDTFIEKVANLFWIIGFVVTLLAVLFSPKLYSIIIFVLYVLMFLLRSIGASPSKLSRVIDHSTKKPLANAIVRVYSVSLGNEIVRKVTNKFGQFYCPIPNGKYYLSFDRLIRDGSHEEASEKELVEVTDGNIRGRYEAVF